MLPRATLAKYYELTGSRNRNLLSHNSEGWKSKIRCPYAWFLLRVLREYLCDSLPAFDALLAIFGIPWPVDPAPQSMPLSWYGVFPVPGSMSKFPIFIRDRAYPTDIIQQNLFPKQVLSVRTSPSFAGTPFSSSHLLSKVHRAPPPSLSNLYSLLFAVGYF